MRTLPVRLVLAALFGLLAGANANASAATPAAQLAGEAVPPAEGQRTIPITSGTRWVNVAHGDIVRFESQGQDFAFDFDGLYNRSFDLASLAPQGVGVDHSVRVYVQPRLDDVDMD
jgi:hypothetical protein